MAGVSPVPAEVTDRPGGPTNLELFSAIAQLRWRLLANSLRTIRGRLELVSRVLVGISMTMGALGVAIFLVPLSYIAISTSHPGYLITALWIIFAFWQLYPMLGSLASVPFEFGTLLRFPMNFTTFWWLAFFYGLVDPVCLVSLFWLFSILLGAGIASPAILPGAFLALLAFALVNLFLARAANLWLERWLAQRKTREILGVVFLFCIVGFQFVSPLMARLENHPRNAASSLQAVAQIARFFPPGLAGYSLQRMQSGQTLDGLLPCAGLAVYIAVLAALVNRRLRAQFLGENLSEAAAPSATRSPEKVREGWDIRGFSAPITAIFEKEMRYLMRSGPVLFMFVMPIVVLALFRVSPARSGAGGAFLARAADFAFPIGAAYALLMLTNIVYNSFGADGSGLQFYLIAPVPLRDVIFAKNLSHTAVLAINIALVFIGTSFLYHPPGLAIVILTLAAMLFAFPLNLSAGNLLSVYSPKRYDLAAFGRQRTSAATGFIGMFVQFFVVGISAVVIFAAYHFGRIWLAGLAFLLLAAASALIYWVILNKSARAAMNRREILVGEICRVGADSTATGRAS